MDRLQIVKDTLKEVYDDWITDFHLEYLAPRVLEHLDKGDSEEAFRQIWYAMPGGSTAEYAADLIEERLNDAR